MRKALKGKLTSVWKSSPSLYCRMLLNDNRARAGIAKLGQRRRLQEPVP